MKPIGYGMVGAGAFGIFCLQAYQQSEHINVIALTDSKPEVSRNISAQFNITYEDNFAQLLARPDIELVHVATPPFTHKALVLQALAAGKHVLCEKPLALSVEDAQEMLGAAAKAGKVLAVNLIMRYDPLNIALTQVLKEKLLGEPIFASLQNLAGDDKLHTQHWFWDQKKSGGIFIEHGVHFFDLFSMWFGEAEILSAEQGERPGHQQESLLIEHVRATARHGNQVLADYYHGFHQPGRLDRQEIRIVCERGDVRLYEWLATDLTLHALLRPADIERVSAVLANVKITQNDAIPVHVQTIQARHKTIVTEADVKLTASVGMTKLELYSKVIRELLEDQIAFIRDKNHARRVTEANGLSSVVAAVAAQKKADGTHLLS